MTQVHLKIVTPERSIVDEMVDEVVVPTPKGQIGILPSHVNLMTKISPGELQIKRGAKVEAFAVGDGFLQVSQDVLTILTDLAVNEEDINEKVVEEAKKRAEEALENKLSDEEYAETLAVLEKSLAQLKVKRRHKVR